MFYKEQIHTEHLNVIWHHVEILNVNPRDMWNNRKTLKGQRRNW